MLITTSIDLPGYEITATLGEVFGLTVRSRNIGAGCLAGLRSLGGGEIPQFTKLLTQSRNEAMARMVAEAESRGANAITAMRFDSGAIGQWSEICAYGTAVWVDPRSDYAREQHAALAGGGQLPHQQGYSTADRRVVERVEGSPVTMWTGAELRAHAADIRVDGSQFADAHGWRTTRPGMPPPDLALNASRAWASG